MQIEITHGMAGDGPGEETDRGETMWSEEDGGDQAWPMEQLAPAASRHSTTERRAMEDDSPAASRGRDGAVKETRRLREAAEAGETSGDGQQTPGGGPGWPVLDDTSGR